MVPLGQRLEADISDRMPSMAGSRGSNLQKPSFRWQFLSPSWFVSRVSIALGSGSSMLIHIYTYKSYIYIHTHNICIYIIYIYIYIHYIYTGNSWTLTSKTLRKACFFSLAIPLRRPRRDLLHEGLQGAQAARHSTATRLGGDAHGSRPWGLQGLWMVHGWFMDGDPS